MSEPQKTVETRGDDRVDLLTADTNIPPLLADQGLPAPSSPIKDFSAWFDL